MSQVEFLEKSKLIHGSKYDYSKSIYVHNNEKVKIICAIHGEFEQRPHQHLTCQGCSECGKISTGNSKRKSFSIFLEKAKNLYGDKYDYSLVEYYDTRTKIKIVCKEHGEFWQIPDSHINSKQGCPKCCSSKGETLINNYLKQNNILFIQEYKFKDCKNKRMLPFDFYLPDHNIAIEFDGKQHYVKNNYFGGQKGFESIQQNDNIKTNYCKVNEIKLLRIRYNQIKNINIILKNYIDTYEVKENV